MTAIAANPSSMSDRPAPHRRLAIVATGAVATVVAVLTIVAVAHSQHGRQANAVTEPASAPAHEQAIGMTTVPDAAEALRGRADELPRAQLDQPSPF